MIQPATIPFRSIASARALVALAGSDWESTQTTSSLYGPTLPPILSRAIVTESLNSCPALADGPVKGPMTPTFRTLSAAPANEVKRNNDATIATITNKRVFPVMSLSFFFPRNNEVFSNQAWPLSHLDPTVADLPGPIRVNLAAEPRENPLAENLNR